MNYYLIYEYDEHLEIQEFDELLSLKSYIEFMRIKDYDIIKGDMYYETEEN